MKYDILIYVGYIGGVAGTAVSIYLFLKLNIKKAFFDLTGLTTRREIKQLSKKKYPYNTTDAYTESYRYAQESVSDTVILNSNSSKETDRELFTGKTVVMRPKEDTLPATALLNQDGMFEGVPKNGDLSDDFVVFTDVTVVHTEEDIHNSNEKEENHSD